MRRRGWNATTLRRPEGSVNSIDKSLAGGQRGGQEALQEELLAQVSAKSGARQSGEELRESAAAKAERLRRETTETMEWIAERLRMEPRRIWRISCTGRNDEVLKKHDTID